ncbi:MAG: hypothetical protein IJZ94_05390 [Clostridia bacterium]|nr:hypothetical protein [Clostridia bacterium]
MKRFLKVVIIILVPILLCSCSLSERYAHEDIRKYMWIPERTCDDFYKINSFTDGVCVWRFELKKKDIEELEKSDKFRDLSDEDIQNIEYNVFYEGIPEWWGLSENRVFYMYAPYIDKECTDTSFLGSRYYIYIWDMDANTYFCVDWY